MIDMLVLRCPFRQAFETSFSAFGVPSVNEVLRSTLSLADLKIPLQAALDADGNQTDLVHRWEKIPSSYSNMAFKVFDFRGSSNKDMQDFYIEIKASPAKLMQGHNLYGSDNLWDCAEYMIHLLIETYPHLVDYLEQCFWSLEQVDITYHSWCRNENEALQFVNALQNVSNGQTRARTGYSGTVYFGKANSRIKKIKVYVKLLEVLNMLQNDKRARPEKSIAAYYPPQLLAWAKGMVRWEASLKTRWFERRGISNNLFELSRVFDAQTFWKLATHDIFKALEGKEMRMIKDADIEKQLRDKFPTVNPQSGKLTYGKANTAYNVYRRIKSDGWIEAKRTIANGTFHRSIEMLHECGLSKAVLQNLQGDGLKCEVIPFIRYVEINFNEQFPPFLEKVA